MGKKQVVLDTNFLLIPGQFKLDIFTEIKKVMDEPYELCVLKGTLDELKILAAGKGKDGQAATLGYVLAEQKRLKTIRRSIHHVDDALVDIAEEGAIIATQDLELKKRVKKAGGKVITMRQKKKLVKE